MAPLVSTLTKSAIFYLRLSGYIYSCWLLSCRKRDADE